MVHLSIREVVEDEVFVLFDRKGLCYVSHAPLCPLLVLSLPFWSSMVLVSMTNGFIQTYSFSRILFSPFVTRHEKLDFSIFFGNGVFLYVYTIDSFLVLPTVLWTNLLRALSLLFCSFLVVFLGSSKVKMQIVVFDVLHYV